MSGRTMVDITDHAVIGMDQLTIVATGAFALIFDIRISLSGFASAEITKADPELDRKVTAAR